MVKPAALTAADARNFGYLNVRINLAVIAAIPHPTASPRQAVVRAILAGNDCGHGLLGG